MSFKGKKSMGTRKICQMALLAALTCIATMSVRIPVAATDGYIHLGDSVILIVGVLFGWEYGLAAGGIGSAMADLLSGYPHWVIPTLIIKAVMGFVVGKISNPNKSDNFFSARNLIASFAGIAVMVIGYFIGGAVLKGSFPVSLVSVPENMIQGGAGLIIHYVMGYALYKAKAYRLADKNC